MSPEEEEAIRKSRIVLPNSYEKTALQLVLLFYTAGEWSDDLKKTWAEKTEALIGKPKDATQHDATTRVLCDCVRKALE